MFFDAFFVAGNQGQFKVGQVAAELTTRTGVNQIKFGLRSERSGEKIAIDTGVDSDGADQGERDFFFANRTSPILPANVGDGRNFARGRLG